MVLLDTSVVSELMHLLPDPGVESWIRGQSADGLFFSAIGEAELRYGVAAMAPGRRRERISSEIDALIREDFEARILPFDSAAARSYASIAAARKIAGRPVTPVDYQIAAIAHSRGMAVGTRNVRHFVDMGIDVIDPWGDA